MRLVCMLSCFAIFAAPLAGAEPAGDLTPVMTKRGKLLLSEDFAGGSIPSEWKVGKGTWEVKDGALKGREVAADQHAATIRRPLDLKNAIFQFSFKFDGGKTTHLSLNDSKGHVCRVTISEQGFQVRKDKPSKASDEKAELLASSQVPFKAGEWYTMLIELSGNELLAQVNDAHHAFGSAPGLERPKTNFGFPAAGDGIWFDNVKVWEAETNPAWPTAKAKLAAKKP